MTTISRNPHRNTKNAHNIILNRKTKTPQHHHKRPPSFPISDPHLETPFRSPLQATFLTNYVIQKTSPFGLASESVCCGGENHGFGFVFDIEIGIRRYGSSSHFG
jgi:hypothetical protein